MRELNYEFFEVYKEIDIFLRDAYSTENGVGEYLNQMEHLQYKGLRYVSTWESDYKELKRVRWIRNQLSHNASFDSDLCEENDYNWTVLFRDKLYVSTDPLSSLRKAEEADNIKRAELHKQKQIKSTAHTYINVDKPIPSNNKENKTIWQRIKRFFVGK